MKSYQSALLAVAVLTSSVGCMDIPERRTQSRRINTIDAIILKGEPDDILRVNEIANPKHVDVYDLIHFQNGGSYFIIDSTTLQPLRTQNPNGYMIGPGDKVAIFFNEQMAVASAKRYSELYNTNFMPIEISQRTHDVYIATHLPDLLRPNVQFQFSMQPMDEEMIKRVIQNLGLKSETFTYAPLSQNPIEPNQINNKYIKPE